jgi:uncharacterized protein YbjQ (UPF0145 family)
MKIMKWTALAAVASMAAAQPALAKKAPRTYVVNNEAVGVPVFPHDITDRPYTVIGEVKAKVRKATVFSKAASQKKIYRELWERARKKGADAVINANYGDSKISAMSWGQTNARGTAIRFTSSSAPTSN